MQYRISLIQHIAKYYKPDSLILFDDYGAGDSMLMQPELWRDLFKPRLKQLIDATHNCGLYYTLHCCGYLKPIFSDIVALGADAVHPIQVCNDVPKLKEKFGDRITFCGGFDNVGILDRPGATEAEIRAEVRRVMAEVAPGGSYVAWQSLFNNDSLRIFIDEILRHSIPQMKAAGVPVPDYGAMVEDIMKARTGD